MAVLPIVKYGDPVLRKPTERITTIDARIQKLIDDMVDTMYAAPGVGLAANQVGVSLRLMIIDLSVGETPGDLHVFINPDFVEKKGEIVEEEGCLSIPDFVETVSRPEITTVRYQDRGGAWKEMSGEGLMARALNHEIDHLDGKLYVDYLRGLRKERLLKKVSKILKSGGWD
ncbi:MAG TPA: peptide deformylase [Thermoanaerobaculia bacterium]|nr:peptide deformylase [Thermoanaerobaculia bacterium]